MEDMNLTNSNVNSENSVATPNVLPESPVIGFQAVDAEGNVLGFVSKADLVNEAKQALYADLAFMEQNRPMTLPANTEQLAAAAAAATDVYEDQLPIKSDAPFIRGLDAAGNPILISKADIATVVGGLIGISLVLKTKGGINIPSRDSTDPMNEITENGIYTIIPANDTYGTLIVFNSFGGTGGIVQFYAHPFGNGIYRFRIKTSNNKNEWSEWKNF